jgi:non-specific serine/threonine protein kinase
LKPTYLFFFLEENGVLVRVPDWWKKRPGPRVGNTIGDKKQKKSDAHTVLDFCVQLALGDQELTPRSGAS